MSASPPDSSSSETSSRLEGEGEIRVEVNGESRALEPKCSVEKLLEVLELGSKRVAVAVNRRVLVRARYPEFELTEGDRIEILEAVGGG